MNKDLNKATVLILACGPSLPPRLQLERHSLQRNGFTVDVLFRERTSKYPLVLLGYYVRVIRTCLKEKPRIVHLTNIYQLPITPILKGLRKQVVYDAYERYSIDISERYFKSVILKKIVRCLIDQCENVLVKCFVDAVLVVSTPDEWLMARYARFCSNAVCLYNVPSGQAIYRGALEEKFSRRPLEIAYLGAIIEEKGSKYMVRVAEYLKNEGVSFRINLYGTFRNELEKELFFHQVKTRGVGDHFVFHGCKEYDDLCVDLWRCHIGLTLYTRNERLAEIGPGSSRKNFTYMSAGMVIITTEAGELSKVVEMEEAGIVIRNVGDIEEIVKQVIRVCEDPMWAVTKARNGINAIERKYNWSNEERKLMDLYRAVLSCG